MEVSVLSRKIIPKIYALPVLNKRHKRKTNVFLSIFPQGKGGGSNTFSYNFKKWIIKNKADYNLVYNIGKADKAVVIAGKADIATVKRAKEQGCVIIHRLDEHIEENEDGYRQQKHAYIKELNKLSSITVYQSNFIFENLHPFLDYPKNYTIIHNGADPSEFYPADNSGEFIGHVTWGVGEKKRLDILYETIVNNPDERFLLVGNHDKSEYDFAKCANVTCVGSVKREEMLNYLHRMKFLFFPSENDPCPNTVIEAILAGVPVCYNPLGGTKELVKDCGLPLDKLQEMLEGYKALRGKCFSRSDLYFDAVARKYMELN